MGYCPASELVKYKEIAGDHPRITFIKPGWIEDVGEQIRGCYALVNAARTEAMGRVHIEAMACGKPIVATRTNGAGLCVADGQTGLLCEIDDAEDLAEKLDQLLSDPELAHRMGEAGRVRMEQTFSEERYIEAFRSMIEEIAESPPAR
jgi:glycosyltransferase involved in cell wall biosynthesis